MLTYKDVSDYHRDGFVVLKNVFSADEVRNMIEAVESGGRVSQSSRGPLDASGKSSKLAIWFELSDDIWSAASTDRRILNPVRILLGEDAAFFHGKVMLKEARTGGAWEWHQDYGYWYNQGFIFPHMMSAFVALDPAATENGCLQVLRGSHVLGRLDHQLVGTQTGADPSRLNSIKTMFEQVSCEMEPGSVLFFHCNLLHASSANESDKHRRSFIICYTATSNPQITSSGLIVRSSCPVGAEAAL